MNRILELREKRAKAWDAAKKFLAAKTGPDGLVSAEDSATYDKMEADVLALGKEVERLERQTAIDAALNAPANQPLPKSPARRRRPRRTALPRNTPPRSGRPSAASPCPTRFSTRWKRAPTARAAIWCRMNTSAL